MDRTITIVIENKKNGNYSINIDGYIDSWKMVQQQDCIWPKYWYILKIQVTLGNYVL